MKVDNCFSVNKIMTFSLGTAEKHWEFVIIIDSRSTSIHLFVGSFLWTRHCVEQGAQSHAEKHDSVMAVKADVIRATLEFGRDSEREFGRRLFACLSRLGRGEEGRTMSSTADALSWLIARRELPPKEERPITTTTSTSSRPSIAPFFLNQNFEIFLTSENVEASVGFGRVQSGSSTRRCESRHDGLLVDHINEPDKISKVLPPLTPPPSSLSLPSLPSLPPPPPPPPPLQPSPRKIQVRRWDWSPGPLGRNPPWMWPPACCKGQQTADSTPAKVTAQLSRIEPPAWG